MSEAPANHFKPVADDQTPPTSEGSVENATKQFTQNQTEGDACAALRQLRNEVLSFETSNGKDAAKTSAFNSEIVTNLQNNGLLPSVQIAALRYAKEEKDFVPSNEAEQKIKAQLDAEEKDPGIQDLEKALTPGKQISPEQYLDELMKAKKLYIHDHHADFPGLSANSDSPNKKDPETQTTTSDGKPTNPVPGDTNKSSDGKPVSPNSESKSSDQDGSDKSKILPVPVNTPNSGQPEVQKKTDEPKKPDEQPKNGVGQAVDFVKQHPWQTAGTVAAIVAAGVLTRGAMLRSGAGKVLEAEFVESEEKIGQGAVEGAANRLAGKAVEVPQKLLAGLANETSPGQMSKSMEALSPLGNAKTEVIESGNVVKSKLETINNPAEGRALLKSSSTPLSPQNEVAKAQLKLPGNVTPAKMTESAIVHVPNAEKSIVQAPGRTALPDKTTESAIVHVPNAEKSIVHAPGRTELPNSTVWLRNAGSDVSPHSVLENTTESAIVHVPKNETSNALALWRGNTRVLDPGVNVSEPAVTENSSSSAIVHVAGVRPTSNF